MEQPLDWTVAVVPRRGGKRTLGWLGRWRRISKDNEYLPETSECVMLRQLAES